LVGGDGVDKLRGNAGDDVLLVDAADLTASGGVVDGGAGTDTLIVSDTGGVFVDLAARNVEIVFGSDGADTLQGSAANEIFRGGGGADVIRGGDGFDIIDFGDRLGGMTIDLRQTQTMGDPTGRNDNFTGIEGIVGTRYNDRLIGDDSTTVGNRLFGGDGYDFLHGGNGNDLLVGGKGDDEYDGGAGADTFVIGHGEGNDRIDALGASGQDRLRFTDHVSYEQLWFRKEGENLRIFLLDGPGGGSQVLVEKWYAASGQWRLAGIDTDDGRTINAAGVDAMVLAMQPFSPFGGDSLGVLRQGLQATYEQYWTRPPVGSATAGDDQIVGRTGGETFASGDGDDTVYAGAGDDTVDGGAGNDWLSGGLGGDTIHGGSGDDVIVAGDGLDYGWGDEDGDRLYGGTGNDTLDGGVGDDALYGEHGDDTLYGGPGEDRLGGGAGNDLIDAGVGDDLMTGGGGADTFVWHGGYGDDVIGAESEASAGDVLHMASENRAWFWFSRDGDDMVIQRLVGARETITVEDMFKAGNDQIDMFRAQGHVLGNGGAATLTNAMAAYLEAHPNFKVSAAAAVPAELLATANTWMAA
jgi:Ca2+-binding RTX toxin-like protein